ncbi:hypothetical protein [Deinococcus sp. AJ005]|uniref:hypothetical protein n=1 Tax=Deinococcus sp. AJ005 TaxID=2652443 RepID=UPI00125CCB5F|nr:hypothetical protein [Deinococcus sp. AJ005]QFP76414.1 hypothetical protein DAAJ005_08055 [Deinococcus sp. AJ005]
MTPIPILAPSSRPERSRTQKVKTLHRVMGLGGGLLAAVGAVLISVGQNGGGELHSVVKGMGYGILAALPFYYAVFIVRAILTMDEYLRALQVQATSIAFMVTMVVSGGLIALETPFKFQTPSLVFYAVGLLSWAAALAALKARSRRE